MKHGVINVDKPQGKTSHDIVAAVRRIIGSKKVGHTGTLDPLATGVLPILIGEATRLSEYLLESDKAYRAEIDFGYMTDTLDITGTVTARVEDFDITPAQFEECLAAFRGKIMQTPPAYSALKHQGKPLYKYAREGRPVIKEAREVTIYELKVLKLQLPQRASLYVRCSKGTYIRSLIDDIGKMLGCGAVMRALCRVQSGAFTLNSAVQLDELTAENYAACLIQMTDAVAHLPRVAIDEADVKRIQNGQRITASAECADGALALLGPKGLAAIGRFDLETNTILPKKVFRQSYESDNS